MTIQPEPGTGVPVCHRHPARETHIRCQRCERPICPDCMRDAAVGFQCPSCVAEGSKSTRSGRTAYGGSRSANPALTSMVLIGINAAVWLLIVATGARRSPLVDWLALVPRGQCASLSSPGMGYFQAGSEAVCTAQTGGDGFWVPGVSDGAGWQLLTSAFAHIDLWHVGFNMLALWILGPQLELAFGRARFLALYLLSALAGSTLVYWASSEVGTTLGASGAIFGLMGALLVVAFKIRGNVQSILIWIGINIVITVVGREFISWQGHLGGFLGGLLIALVIVYAPRERRARWQAAGLVAVAIALLGAVLVRTSVLL